MVRAELRDGLFHPLDPIPADWVPGKQLRVDEIDAEPAIQRAELEQWLRDLDEATAPLDNIEEWALIEQSLADANRQAKAQIRRETGLPS